MYRIVAGLLSGIKRAAAEFIYYIAKFIPHPDYDPTTVANDIGLIKVSRDFVYSTTIKPIAFAEEFVGGGVDVIVSGWGITSVSINRFSELN